MKVLVANRGEVAVRVLQAVRERNGVAVAVAATDDVATHTFAADEVFALPAAGPAAYLDIDTLIDAARSTGCTHVHPGYGFLSEDPEFARRCATAGLVFVGPSPEVLEVLGDKASAKAAAMETGVPVLDGTKPDASLEEVRELLDRHPGGGVVVKAQSAGGGHGLRIVTEPEHLDNAYARCADEGALASGRREVFAEEYLTDVHHVEVQVLGVPASVGVHAFALGDRDCSTQRSMQKLLEVAPAAWLADEMRSRLHADAVILCAAVGLVGLATVEFLVSGDRHVFLEVNPRLQVEHTVTEEVTGLDLVQLQLAVADGATIDDLNLPPAISAVTGSAPSGSPIGTRGTAIQCRVNAEILDAAGHVSAAAGTVAAFTPPTGAGVRVDTYLRPGIQVSGRYDTLLAKVIVHTHAGIDVAAVKAASALDDLSIEGVSTNRRLLAAILREPDFAAGAVTTAWLQEQLPRLAPAVASADVLVGADDPELASGEVPLRATMLGTVVALADVGTVVAAGAEVAVLEAMKMQHAVVTDAAVEIVRVFVEVGDTVSAGAALVATRAVGGAAAEVAGAVVPLDLVRPDLEVIVERHRLVGDDARTDRLARIRARGRRTARENVADLVDDGTFLEYAPLVLAAQRRRKSVEQLIAETPADGIIAGTATINADRFGPSTDAIVLAYDYSVAAGTQGYVGHLKTDRLLDIAARGRFPVVLFAEGGGGRPSDSDVTTTGVTAKTFRAMAELQGRAPLVSIVSGRCFAGNAALAGACDVLIATPEANLGMGGPAMIEGGGLGTVAPEDIGPIEVQRANGVVHIVADDEAHAVALAKEYLGYFQGRTTEWEAPDPRVARHVVPANRLRAFDVREAIDALADVGSVLELRRDYGRSIVTALARFEGHPCAVIANDSRHLGGAIDADAAQKATAFLRVVRDFELPLLSLADTPGFMVGPAAEQQASVTHFSAMFVAGAQLRAPVGAIVLRKGYGLGVMAMFTGHVHVPRFAVAWPTGELGGMGLEGAVRLGARRELEAIEDPVERKHLFDGLVELAYEMGQALNAATYHELDDVIDPADSRRWIRQLFRSSTPATGR